MIGNIMIKIELTNEDADLFKQFREHQDVFQTMFEAGVFDTKLGVVSLSFNNEKVLTQVKKDILTYKKTLQVVEVS